MAMAETVLARIDVIRAFMRERQWGERELAQHMGLAHSYVNRVLARKRRPGPKFIAGIIRLGLTWDEAFYIGEDAEPERAEP
ncbi:MAG: helix-turn-helix transcriptional regulator [Firmicutes bacterium]|nr:helix-turn-helix transcriptional regulator [Bacillota bacterium]